MTTNQSLRWLEVRFFYVLHEVLDWNGDMLDVEDLIYKLASLTRYNPSIVLTAGVEILQSNWLQPSRDEVMCLANLNMLSRKQLNKMIRIHNETYYAIMERAMQTAYLIRPYLAQEAHPEIQKFMQALEKVKGLGI